MRGNWRVWSTAVLVAATFVPCAHGDFMPFSMNVATSSRSVQVHILMSQSASLHDLNNHSTSITSAFHEFLTRAGQTDTTVTVVDASIVGQPELSLYAKGELEVTLDVALTSTASRSQVLEATHGSVTWSGVKTNVASVPFRFNLLGATYPWEVLWDTSFGNIPRFPEAPYVSLYLVMAHEVAPSVWLRIRVKHAVAFVLGVSPASLHISTDWAVHTPLNVYNQPTTVVLVVVELTPSRASHRDEIVQTVNSQRVALQASIRVFANLTLLASSIQSDADAFRAQSTYPLSLAVQPLLYRTPHYFAAWEINTDDRHSKSSSIYLQSFARQTPYSFQTIHQDIATLAAALNAATTSVHLPVWQFNRLIVLPTAQPWPPLANTTEYPGASLVIDLVVDATDDSISAVLEQTQHVVADFASTWAMRDTNMVAPTAATTWTPHLTFACGGPLTHSIAHVRVALAALFNVSYSALECVSTFNESTLWELDVRDPWHRVNMITRFNTVELWHDAFLPFLDSPPPNCTLEESADGVFSALPLLYPSSAAPWNDVAAQDGPSACLAMSQIPLARPATGEAYGSPPSGECVWELCVELSLMSAGSPPLVLDLVEASPNVVFVEPYATSLLLDQFATWTLQTSLDVLDVVLYFRFANTHPPVDDPSNTSDVVVRLHVFDADNVREVTASSVVGAPVRLVTRQRELPFEDDASSPVAVTLHLPHLDPPANPILPNPECDFLVEQCHNSTACLNQYNCMPYLIFSQMLLDDESTAGTMSDITDNVSSCFHDSTDAASWQVHAAAIQCAISRPHYFHHTSTVMTVFQQPVMPRQTWQLVADATLLLTLELKDASVVLTIDQTTSEQLLARQIFDLVAAEAAAVQVDVHQALVPSTDGSTTPRIGWEVVVEYLNYVGELPQATYSASSGVATMSQVNPRLVLAVVPTPYPLSPSSPPAPTPSLPAIPFVGAVDRCVRCHDRLLACMQTPACAAIFECAVTSRSLLAFPLGYVETTTPDALGTCQDRASSNAAWRQFVATRACFAQRNCPTGTNAVDRMVTLTITSASHTLRLPRQAVSTRLVYRLDNGTVVASARWTNTSACASLATTLQGQLMAVTSISSVLVDWDTSAAEDILTIVYKDHVGRLPRLAVVTSGQGLAHRIVASEASLVQTIQPLNTSQYIVGPTPCPCGTFGTTFAGALASVATSLSSSQPFDDISSLLETSATPADLVVTSCYAASSCPLVPPLAHSAVVITLTPTIVTLLVYPTSTGLATSTYSADFTLGTVPAILRVSPTTTAASLLQSLLAQDATLSPDASVDLSCDVAGVCRATLLLPYIAGPLPSIDVQTTTNANVNAFTSFPNHVDATTPQRLQRVTLRLF